MRLNIRCHGIEPSEELNRQVMRRTGFGLRRFATHIATVTVRLSDSNGPRGGQDKHCRILVAIADGSLVAVEELDTDVFVAIAGAAERAGSAVGRYLNRIRRRDQYSIRGTNEAFRC